MAETVQAWGTDSAVTPHNDASHRGSWVLQLLPATASGFAVLAVRAWYSKHLKEGTVNLQTGKKAHTFLKVDVTTEVRTLLRFIFKCLELYCDEATLDTSFFPRWTQLESLSTRPNQVKCKNKQVMNLLK